MRALVTFTHRFTTGPIYTIYNLLTFKQYVSFPAVFKVANWPFLSQLENLIRWCICYRLSNCNYFFIWRCDTHSNCRLLSIDQWIYCLCMLNRICLLLRFYFLWRFKLGRGRYRLLFSHRQMYYSWLFLVWLDPIRFVVIHF